MAPAPDGERSGVAGVQTDVGADLSIGRGTRAPSGTGATLEERFQGRGRLRGRVEVEGTDPFPTEWRLVIEPSTYLIGSEHAEGRVIDFTDGRQDFDVQDLPLAGYDVRAEAAGWNSRTTPILLEARSPNIYCSLVLVRAGTVDGRVLDDAGRPAEGVLLTLTALPQRTMREATTDSLGEFRFEDVVDGAYEFGVGPFQNPILRERRTLRVTAPGMTIPDVELPPLASLSLVLFDAADQRLLQDVLVTASGAEGGAFEERTDAWGELLVRHLPPGHWRLRFELDGYSTRREQVELVAGETFEVAIAIGR